MTDSVMPYLSAFFSGAPSEAPTAMPLDAGGSGFGGSGFSGVPTPQDAGIPGAGAAFSAAPSATGVDTSALAGLGDSFSAGGNTGASVGERGLSGAGGLSSAVSQYNAPVAGVGAGVSPAAFAAPASVAPTGGGAGTGNFNYAVTDGGGGPSSVTGTSNYNTGGVVGNLNAALGGDTMSGFRFDAPAGAQPQAGATPGWSDAAKGFMKDYGSLAGPAVSGGGLLAALMKGNQKMPGEGELRAQAADFAAQGKTLQSYLTSGTLPPGVAQSLHSAGEAAKTSIRSQYAARGMSGSDAEARDLANVDTSIVTQGAGIASDLLSKGVQESGLSAQLYQTIMNAATQEDASLGQAISGFAQSLVPRQNVFIGSGKP